LLRRTYIARLDEHMSRSVSKRPESCDANCEIRKPTTKEPT